jgi:hypothetical protein
MWPFSRLRDVRYCAFCRAKHKVYTKKHVNLTNVVVNLMFTLAVTYGIFSEFDPVGLLLFASIMIASEMFVYFRWRQAIVCSLCGFDPILYKRSPAMASQKVTEFFHEQVNNPEFWLSRSPLLSLQKRIRAEEKKKIEHQIVKNRAKAKDSMLAPDKSL